MVAVFKPWFTPEWPPGTDVLQATATGVPPPILTSAVLRGNRPTLFINKPHGPLDKSAAPSMSTYLYDHEKLGLLVFRTKGVVVQNSGLDPPSTPVILIFPSLALSCLKMSLLPNPGLK